MQLAETEAGILRNAQSQRHRLTRTKHRARFRRQRRAAAAFYPYRRRVKRHGNFVANSVVIPTESSLTTSTFCPVPVAVTCPDTFGSVAANDTVALDWAQNIHCCGGQRQTGAISFQVHNYTSSSVNVGLVVTSKSVDVPALNDTASAPSTPESATPRRARPRPSKGMNDTSAFPIDVPDLSRATTSVETAVRSAVTFTGTAPHHRAQPRLIGAHVKVAGNA